MTKLNIVLVEDDVMLAEATIRWFQSAFDAEVRWATTIAEGRTLLREHLPLVVLSDNGLPDGRGIEFLKEVQFLYPGLPCILWSGYLSREDQEEAECLDGAYEKGFNAIEQVGGHIQRIKDRIDEIR